MKKFAKLACGIAAAVALSVSFASAQTNYLGGTYTENFDSMGSAGTVPPTGWFASTRITGSNINTTNGTIGSAVLVPGTGTGTSGTNYNFGVAGVGLVTDRALGTIASGTSGAVAMEFRFTNGTGLTISDLAVSYDGEQWRNGGNTASNELSLFYSTDGSTFTAANFDFTSPTVGATSAALDGNASSNRVAAIGGTITGLSIANGSTFYLRWLDLNEVGTDHGMAIDNFSMTATLVPEPSTVVLVGAGLLGVFALRRRS